MTAQVYADMSGIDVAIVEPFLKGICDLHEEKIAEEILSLKPYIEQIGGKRVEAIVKSLADEGRHQEIITSLKKKADEINSSPKRSTWWPFRGLFKEAADGTNNKNTARSPPSHSDDTRKSNSPIQQQEHHTPSPEERNHASNLPAEPIPTMTDTHTRATTNYTFRESSLSRRLKEEENEMSRNYDFGAEPGGGACVVGVENKTTDADFQAIFGHFLDSASNS